jgi:heptosyltransferase II
MARSVDSERLSGEVQVGQVALRADPSRILIVLPKWVGDLVLATPALTAMRQRFANVRISFLVKHSLTDVLSGGNWSDELLFWPTAKGQSRPQRRQGFLGLAAELRERQFDWAVLLTNSFRSALLTRLAGIPRRIGYDRDGRGLLLTDRLLPQKSDGKYVPVPMTRYYNAVARYLGCRDCTSQLELHTTDGDESNAATEISQAGVQPGQPIVIINPGASFGPAKCWPAERFAQVADELSKRHGTATFIACGPEETEIARAVASSMHSKAHVLDRPVMKLGALKALVRRSNLLITNDTGPRHFANAFGTPVITLFGPTDPEWTATESPRERSLMVKVNCGPCMKRKCPLDHRCMTRITTDMVLTEASQLLTGGRPAPAAEAVPCRGH